MSGSLGAMTMISFAYLSLLCLAYAAALEEVQQTGSTPAPEEVPGRELTSAGYVIRHGDQVYRYPLLIEPLVRSVRPSQRNQIDANAIRTNEIETEEEGKGRPLFYFTTYEKRQQDLPTSRPYIEIRKKRDVDESEIPESSKVGKLRKKRTYCGKCGGGGGRGGGYYAVPVTYAVYPVYYGGGGGGGGKGCNTCGGYGGGGGGGGSYSYSSSSAQSSSGSFGWGK